MGDLNAMFKKNRVCDEIITRLSRFITFTTDTEKVRTVRGLVITAAGAESHQVHQGDTRAVCPLDWKIDKPMGSFIGHHLGTRYGTVFCHRVFINMYIIYIYIHVCVM